MERSAFEQMARTWREKALKVSRHYGAGIDEAEDIAQDVMLRLWQMHDELEQYRSVEALVSLMARHQLRNHQRRKPSEALDEAMIVSLTTSPQEVLEMKEDDKWLSEKLQQLPTTQRTLLYMRQVERRTAHLIIYATGGTTKSRRDSHPTGYRDHISQHTIGKGTTNIIRRNKTEESDMIRYTKAYIKDLLDKYMDGTSTLEEEDILADYFRGKDIPQEWEDYRLLFQEIEAMKKDQQTMDRLECGCCYRSWYLICSCPPSTNHTANRISDGTVRHHSAVFRTSSFRDSARHDAKAERGDSAYSDQETEHPQAETYDVRLR